MCYAGASGDAARQHALARRILGERMSSSTEGQRGVEVPGPLPGRKSDRSDASGRSSSSSAAGTVPARDGGWHESDDDIPFSVLGPKRAAPIVPHVDPSCAEGWRFFDGFGSCGDISASDQRRYRTNNRVSKVCNWLLTVYDESWASYGLPYKDGVTPAGTVAYICGQPEVCRTIDPSTSKQRRHFQGFVSFTTEVGWDGIGQALGIKLFWARGAGTNFITNAIDYTKKSRSARLTVDGLSMWREWGTVPVNQYRGKERYHKVLEILKDGGSHRDVLDFDPYIGLTCAAGIQRATGSLDKAEYRPQLQVYLLYGSTNVGKTHAVHFFLEHDAVNGINPDLYVKMKGAIWWDTYRRHEAVLFDDFNSNDVALDQMLLYTHGFPLTMQVKGSICHAHYKRLYITCNSPIEEWYQTARQRKELQANWPALLRRIPPENRCEVVVRVPGDPRKMEWKEFKKMQEDMKVHLDAEKLMAQEAPRAEVIMIGDTQVDMSKMTADERVKLGMKIAGF